MIQRVKTGRERGGDKDNKVRREKMICARAWYKIEVARAGAQEHMNRAAWNAFAIHYQREAESAERPPTANPQDTLLTKVGYFPPSRVSIFWEGDSKGVRALDDINENTLILMELPLQGNGDCLEMMMNADRPLRDMLFPRVEGATTFQKCKNNMFKIAHQGGAGLNEEIFSIGPVSTAFNHSNTPNVNITHSAFQVDMSLGLEVIIFTVATTTRNVTAGEELTIAYRADASDTHQYIGDAPDPRNHEIEPTLWDLIQEFGYRFLQNPAFILVFVRQRLAFV